MSTPREKAWETRRAKYGPRGHASNYSRPCCSCQRMRKAIAKLHAEGVLTEGQASKLAGINRVELRKLADKGEQP